MSDKYNNILVNLGTQTYQDMFPENPDKETGIIFSLVPIRAGLNEEGTFYTWGTGGGTHLLAYRKNYTGKEPKKKIGKNATLIYPESYVKQIESKKQEYSSKAVKLKTKQGFKDAGREDSLGSLFRTKQITYVFGCDADSSKRDVHIEDTFNHYLDEGKEKGPIAHLESFSACFYAVVNKNTPEGNIECYVKDSTNGEYRLISYEESVEINNFLTELQVHVDIKDVSDIIFKQGEKIEKALENKDNAGVIEELNEIKNSFVWLLQKTSKEAPGFDKLKDQLTTHITRLEGLIKAIEFNPSFSTTEGNFNAVELFKDDILNQMEASREACELASNLITKQIERIDYAFESKDKELVIEKLEDLKESFLRLQLNADKSIQDKPDADKLNCKQVVGDQVEKLEDLIKALKFKSSFNFKEEDGFKRIELFKEDIQAHLEEANETYNAFVKVFGDSKPSLTRVMFENFSDGNKTAEETFKAMKCVIEEELERKFNIRTVYAGLQEAIVKPDDTKEVDLKIVDLRGYFDPNDFKPVGALEDAIFNEIETLNEAIETYKNHLERKFSETAFGAKKITLDELLRNYRGDENYKWDNVDQTILEDTSWSGYDEKHFFAKNGEDLSKKEEKIFMKYYLVSQAQHLLKEDAGLGNLKKAKDLIVDHKSLFEGDNFFARLLNKIFGMVEKTFTKGQSFFKVFEKIQPREEIQQELVDKTISYGAVAA